MSINPFFPVVLLWPLMIKVDSLQELINLFEIIHWLILSLLIFSITSWNGLLLPTEAKILWLVIKKARSCAIDAHVEFLVLPEEEIKRALSHTLFAVKNVQHGASKRSFRLLLTQIVHCDAHMSIWGKITNSDWELKLLSKFIVGEDTRLHLGLKKLMI